MPVILIDLLRRFWWLLPFAGLAGTATVFHIQRDHARVDLATANAVLAQVKALAKVQNDHADAVIREQQGKNDALTAKLDSSLKAGGLTAAALADSLRKYAADHRAVSVPADSSSTARADEAVARPGRDSEVTESLNGIIGAALECHAELTAWQEWGSNLAK